MFIDDDDEFGELYSDILTPLAASSPNPSHNFPAVAAPSTNPNSSLSSVAASSTNPITDLSHVPALSTNPIPNLCSVSAPVSTQNLSSKFCSSDNLDGLINREPNRDWMPDNWDDDDSKLEDNTKVQPEARGKVEISGVVKAEDWDSDDDSEDDLNILLNYDSIGVVETNEVEKEDILIAYDNNECNLEGNQDINDGDLERKENDLENSVGLDGLKANEALRNGDGNFGQQQQSMFKYVRFGATVADAPGQIHPPGQTVTPIAGHGRGEWRPSFGLKNFGSGWANNASRPFGGGLDFTLPSYKTIFDVDIEVFEEKRWRHPGVDISDYFNFDLNEESWKVYARQLDQLRIESTMQSKIRVHESDRSKQEYDPDLPPELAAAAGNHDISAHILISGRIDNGHSDLNGQGRGSPYKLPVGRPILVETGNGERMPFAETRPPRPHDPDVIIEVFPRGHLVDETAAHDDAFELPDKDLKGEKCNSIGHADYDGHIDSEYGSHASRYFNDDRKEISNDRHRENGSFSTHRGRSTERSSRRKHGGEDGKDDGCRKGKRENSMSAKSSPNQSTAKAESAKRVLSVGHTDDIEEKLALDDNIVLEDDGTSDSITCTSRNRKLSSKVEPVNKDDINNEGDDLRNTPSETSLQDGRFRIGSMRRYANDYGRQRRHELRDRKHISSRGHETMPHPNRIWGQPYPMRPFRGPKRIRDSDSSFWREHKSTVNERIDRDDGLKMRERSSRICERKDEDHHRRERAEKGETDRRKREKENIAEDHYHTSRHKDDNYREREVEDRQRLKHPYDDHWSRRTIEKDSNQIIDKRQHKENEDCHAHEKRHSNNERSSRVHSSRSSGFDKTSKESTRKDNVQNSSSGGKRKHEDSTNPEKVRSKAIDGKENEENDDEMKGESKRGRSKVERWSNDMKEVDMAENGANGNTDVTDPEGHLDPETIEKMRRRRERFKTPLTCEKDTSPSRKLDKTVLQPNYRNGESEARAERPPCRRRWMSN